MPGVNYTRIGSGRRSNMRRMRRLGVVDIRRRLETTDNRVAVVTSTTECSGRATVFMGLRAPGGYHAHDAAERRICAEHIHFYSSDKMTGGAPVRRAGQPWRYFAMRQGAGWI